MSEIKFTDEELQKLNELSNTYQSIQTLMGQNAVQKYLNEQQSERIEENYVKFVGDYADNQQAERDLVQELNKKYGPGQLNAQTGVFTPTPTEETQEISSDGEKD